ncbi:MAG: 2-C-methyl-D-erythritol 2,4-cyclodiphosphate synthase [Armatimonadota bacterium]|nr:2-C-methyl-D-erythritol 2,4-cyclodiphosphate synthase [Armatimonadota bacterium]
MKWRVGIGFDAHQFSPDRPLKICGVTIPYHKGLLGHSDADVALHALCDAILGALALGDIGQHFPDTDPKYKDADSATLVQSVLKMASERGWEIGNVDISIIAQSPKLVPFKDAMRLRLSELLRVEIEAISVKATTTDRMGFVGREEGIAAIAIVTLFQKV